MSHDELYTHCQCDFCDGEDCAPFNKDREAEIKAARQRGQDEGREKVLKGILVAMNDPQLAICDTGYLEHAYWVDYIKSLRSSSGSLSGAAHRPLDNTGKKKDG